MKIAFFDDRYLEVYGAQENVLLLAELAQRNGHDVRFVTTYEGELAAAARQRNLTTEIIDAPASLRVFDKELLKGGLLKKSWALWLALVYSAKVHRQLKDWQPDILMSSAIRPCLLLFRSRMARMPKVLLFAQNSIPLGLIGASALPGVDRVCLISSGARDSFPSWALKRHESRVRKLPSGRDLSRYHVDVDEHPVGKSLKLLTVCSIDRRKGLHVLVDALKILRERGVDVELTVVGGTHGQKSEAYFEELKSAIADHDVSVQFVGWQDDVLSFYRQANVFVLASFHEGLPGVLLEAIAAGLPCVTTSAGGSADAIVEGESGFVVPPGQPTALANQLERLVDEARRRKFGLRAQQLAVEKYSVAEFYKRFDVLIREFEK